MLQGTTELVEDHREELIDDNYSMYLSKWSNVETLLTETPAPKKSVFYNRCVTLYNRKRRIIIESN